MKRLRKMNVSARLGTLLVSFCMAAAALVYIWSGPTLSSQITPLFRVQDLQGPSPPPPPPQGISTRPAIHTEKPTNLDLHNPTLRMSVPPEINPPKPAKARCPPRKHVLFLKTHKCAGSTIQNIIYRFGIKSNLDFVLPLSGHYLSDETRDFITNRKQLVAATDGQYDIIANHAVLSEALMKLLPSDAIKITSIRDPATHFGSVFDYCNIGNYVGLPGGKAGAEIFLADTTKYYYKNSRQPPYIHNQMLKDLGFPDRNSRNRTAVVEYINWLDTVFDLVILTEYFPESIVLMRDLLCWKDEEVISTILNKRPTAFSVGSATADKIYAFNWQDKLLYDHFKAKLIKRVDEYGKDKMAQEIHRLKKITQAWVVQCGLKEVLSSSKTKFPTYGNKATTFEIKPEKLANASCVFLIMPELKFNEFVRSIQLAKLQNSTSI